MRLQAAPFWVVFSLALVGVGSGAAQPMAKQLPAAPNLEVPPRALDIDDLAQVPEVHFQDLQVSFASTLDLIPRISHLNEKRPDHFIEVLLEHRPDLASLPFVLGEAARLKQPERERLATAVLSVREALRLLSTRDAFWNKHVKASEGPQDVAALTQMLTTEPSFRPGLIEHLARCDHEEATRAMARLAIFAEEEWIRRAARNVLKERDTRPATEIFMQGLRYPWPAAAQRTAEALMHLQRTDFVPELVKMLDEPDPRAPLEQEINGKKVHVVRELVRINHLRNCLLCHPPLAVMPDIASNLHVEKSLRVLTRELPDPKQPLPRYIESRDSVPFHAVRADITYLRQDFSLLQKVDDAAPWPAMQRFDFLVRERVLTDEEAQSYQAEFARRKGPSPYRQAVSAALRGLKEPASDTTLAKIACLVLGGTSLVLLQRRLVDRWRRSRTRRNSAVAELPL